jgi:hypothetical protein
MAPDGGVSRSPAVSIASMCTVDTTNALIGYRRGAVRVP